MLSAGPATWRGSVAADDAGGTSTRSPIETLSKRVHGEGQRARCEMPRTCSVRPRKPRIWWRAHQHTVRRGAQLARDSPSRRDGITTAIHPSMPQKHPPAPRSYDEITRRTVPNPDSSWRPTEQQEEDAYAGRHFLTDDERKLLGRVTDVLLDTPGIDMCGVNVEVEDTRVTLRGHCANPSAIERIVRAVSSIEEVSEVVDRLVVSAEPME
ncbi:MAG: BON domain-containing protein [Kofleriaceae bacterium]|nr:BON domain-containing protein [Kofleriaceae bacterium]